METRLKAAREARHWSQLRLLSELGKRGRAKGLPMPSQASLKTAISRWENGHHTPHKPYVELLAEIYETTPAALGLDDVVGHSPATDQLRARLDWDREPDGSLQESLSAQTEAIRVQDRQFGAELLLEQMRAHVNNIEHHLSHSVFDSARRPLAQLLADAGALAGWQALDLGLSEPAWCFFQTAIRAAHEAQDPALLAFARVEHAQVLVDLGRPDAAAQLSESAWEQFRPVVSRGVRCWLAAAAGELYAGAGQGVKARAMLTTAQSTSNSLTADLPPYLVFDEAHLDRWIGHSLVLLGDKAATTTLRRAAGDMDGSFTRARAALHIDLALALRDRGEPEEAAMHVRRAESLATKVRSRRQLERVRQLQAAP
jgi:transcriptional regulator with XRE-family HTH domain